LIDVPHGTLSKDPRSQRLLWPVKLRTFQCPACGRVDRWEPVEFIEELYPDIRVYCDCGSGMLVFNFEVGVYPSANKASA
jgi:hypothetical protein